MSATTSVDLTTAMTYKGLTVMGLRIAYREAGDTANRKLVLLHGFPASSHQYRNLIPSLSDRFHVIAPDYPGFGDSERRSLLHQDPNAPTIRFLKYGRSTPRLAD